MKTLSTLTMADLESVQESIDWLKGLEFSTKGLEEQLSERVAESSRQPESADQRWSLQPTGTIAEHLGNRMLSCQLAVGRMYKLTGHQRGVIRDWLDMTPAEMIECVELYVFPQSPECVRRVTFVSCDPVTKRTRLAQRFSIDHWGQFCDKVKERKESEDILAEKEPKETTKKSAKSSEPKTTLAELMKEYEV